MAPGIRFPLAPFIVPGWLPSCLLPLPCVPAAPQAPSPVPGSRRRLEFAAQGVVEWGLLKRIAANFGEQQLVHSPASAAFSEQGQGRTERQLSRERGGQGKGLLVATCERRQPGHRQSPGQPRGTAASGSPLLSRNLSRNPSRAFGHTALTPRWRDRGRGSCSPRLEIASSRILKFSSEHVRRGKPSAAGALQGPVKSGNPSVYTGIFIQSGSVLLLD